MSKPGNGKNVLNGGTRKKKTSIGNGAGTRFKNRGSASNPSKGYRKKSRGQGKA